MLKNGSTRLETISSGVSVEKTGMSINDIAYADLPPDRVIDPWGSKRFAFFCPGCGHDHWFKCDGETPTWTWNGDYIKPTVSPSIFCNPSDPQSRCHLFMADGKLAFLGDSWHKLAGQTVPMEIYEW